MPVNLPDNSHKAKPKALASRSFAARFSTILTSRYCTSASIGALLQCASAFSKVVSLQATQGPCTVLTMTFPGLVTTLIACVAADRPEVLQPLPLPPRIARPLHNLKRRGPRVDQGRGA